MPGLYRVAYEDSVTVNVPFDVARDPEESKRQMLDSAELTQIAESAGVVFNVDEVEVNADGESQPRSEPIWGALLLLLVTLLLLELILSCLISRQRSSTVVHTA